MRLNRKLWLILCVVAAMAAAGVPAAQASAEPSASVRVVSSTEEIDFPNQVTFRLELESDSAVADVKLLYRLGSQNVTVYGYPRLASSDGRLTAEFSVETGGSSYIPPGTDFEYYYVVKDASGNEFETEKAILEYLDPRYEWRRYERDGLIVLYHERREDAVADVASDVNERLRDVRQLMGLSEVKPMKAVILNGSGEAGRSFPLISATAQQDHLFGGFAFGKYDLFLLMGLNRDGMIHEMTHLLLDEAVGPGETRVPAWLNEGLAMHFEAGARARASTVQDAARRDELLPLRSMGRVPGRPSDVRVFYAQAWSVVDYMMSAYDQSRMTELLRSIASGMRIEEALPAAYGMTLNQLESKWLGSLGEDISSGSDIDPGTLGTSLLVGGAAAVAIVAVILRWFRHLTGSQPPSQPGASGSG
ncbi:MAG: hypothetical protein L0177_05490 [Chloroflexi bacterium]|nr:hypothetical protein [Chloroflexota bacterium]